MMELTRIWVAMLTRGDFLDGNTGTNSKTFLSININGEDRLNHTFSDISREDQDNHEKNETNIREIDVRGKNIRPEELNDSSIRIGILGNDAWRPLHYMVWGERRNVITGLEVIPLALETEITEQLSTDPNEGSSGMRLRPVERGTSNSEIRRLFLFITTSKKRDLFVGRPSTNSPIEIQIVNDHQLVVLSEIRNTPQRDLEEGGANFYSAPVIIPFNKGNLNNRSITLRVKGLDNWKPSSLFVFGLNVESGRPDRIVPLVHLPEWPHGNMSSNPTTGNASIKLQLSPEPFSLPERENANSGNQLAQAFLSLGDGQEKLIGLMEKLLETQNAKM